MKYFLVILTVNLLAVVSKSSPQEENIGKVGLPQFIVIENIINLAGNDCSTRKKTSINMAKQDAITCLGDLSITGSYCHFLLKEFMKCAKPLIQIIEECNKETILEGFFRAFVEATFSQSEYVCDTDGEQIFELLNPCLFRSLELKEPCVNKFVTEIQSVTRTNKKLLDVTCQAASSAKSCLQGTIENECSNNMTKRTVMDMYTATVKPCNISSELLKH